MWAKPKSWSMEEVTWQKGFWTGLVMGAGAILTVGGTAQSFEVWNIDPALITPFGMMLIFIASIVRMRRMRNKSSV